MKYLLILILSLELLAFDSATASKIFDKIFTAMIKKDNIAVYTSNIKYKDVVTNSSNLYLSANYEEADIILVDSFEEVPKDSNGILFTTSYLVYENNKNAVGSFYWERGRIKIEFSRKRLNAKKLTLPKSFHKYIKDGN